MLTERAGLCKNLWAGSGDGKWAEGHQPPWYPISPMDHVLGRSQLWDLCLECRQHRASSSRVVGTIAHHTATVLQAGQLPQWGTQKRTQHP